MKILILFLLFVSIKSNSQNRLDINLGYGYYSSNSENSLKIMGTKKFSTYLFYGFSYQRENLLGIDVEFEYNYNKLTKENTLIFVRQNQIAPHDSFGGDVVLINHTFDFDYLGKFSKLFSYGIGLSLIITNRIFEVEGISPEYKSPILFDNLASSGFGANCYLGIRVPFSKEKEHFYFSSKFKLRYTHSIWFDKGIRKLDNYNQEFLTGNISLGIGYLF